MKTIYLVRHAKSSWKYPALEDFERPLSGRGRRSAPLMGTVLKKLKTAPHLMISSPANRAAMTARMIAGGIDYPLDRILYSEVLYMSDKKALLDVIKNMDDVVSRAMLIGHNPAITELAAYISDRRITNIPTCGACRIDLDITSWIDIDKNCGKMRFFEFPKNHVP
ncbi:MAG: histidine phosphatase family protein [Deltaproteobacteria bacterium]|nr:histidine phosphatase family protein [Deltaproteobacteria bacterium]